MDRLNVIEQIFRREVGLRNKTVTSGFRILLAELYRSEWVFNYEQVKHVYNLLWKLAENIAEEKIYLMIETLRLQIADRKKLKEVHSIVFFARKLDKILLDASPEVIEICNIAQEIVENSY